MIINKGKIVVQDSIQHLATMEKGQNRLQVRLRRDVDDMKKVLTDIRDAVGFHMGASPKEWRIDVQGGEEAVDAISARIVSQGLGLLELSPTKLDLEDVFLKVTYGQDSSRGEA